MILHFVNILVLTYVLTYDLVSGVISNSSYYNMKSLYELFKML